VVSDIEASDGKALLVQGDIRNPLIGDSIFEHLEEKFGRVSVVVNNAGIREDGLLAGLSDESWKNVMNTNVTASFYISRRAIPTMVKARHGRIINITSFVGNQSISGISNYAASKAALSSLTRSLAIEVAHRGVTVNSIAPGLVRTDLTRELSHFENSVNKSVPMKRPAEVYDIAEGVRFLSSEQASYITGQTLAIDGGLSAMAFSIN
jgi:3-oxoacyl-[acyl-carrier protein] reductase